jgi:hypothetical protein
MNPLCPSSNTAENGSTSALKRHACDFTHQQTTHDDYNDQEDKYEDGLAIGQLVVM